MAGSVQFPLATLLQALARKHKNKHCSVPKLRHRGTFRREPKRRFILFCEGENTEQSYFKAIKRLCTSTLIKVEIVARGDVPYALAQKAVKRAKAEGLTSSSRNSFEENDEIWAVFDRDDHPRFEEAITICRQSGIQVGRSNQCFEVWLILHERDYDKYQDRRQVQAELSKIRPEYDSGGAKTPDCDEIVTRVGAAELRAETQLKRRELEDDQYGNPSTTVGRLTSVLSFVKCRIKAFQFDTRIIGCELPANFYLQSVSL